MFAAKGDSLLRISDSNHKGEVLGVFKDLEVLIAVREVLNMLPGMIQEVEKRLPEYITDADYEQWKPVLMLVGKARAANDFLRRE